MKSPTQRKIAALKPLEKRYSVALGYGLSLKVQPSGAKSFVLRLCLSGRVTDILLGHFPEMSLGEAKQAARRRRKAIGKEPPKGYVLADAFRLWCNLKKGRIVSYADERRRLEKYIIKPLGSKQIDEITAPLVIQTVRCIEAAGHRATLKRVLMRTREILDLAVCAGYIQHNPCERVSKVFAPPVVTPMPSVPWQELSPHPRSDFVFAGRNAGSHISEQTLAKYLRGTELAGRLVAHGLRSIGRSWMADNCVPFEVGEACLSHVSGSQVSRAYLRSDYLKDRVSVMWRWCSFILACAREGGLLPDVLSKLTS